MASLNPTHEDFIKRSMLRELHERDEDIVPLAELARQQNPDDIFALSILGKRYRTGYWRVPANPEKAEECFKKILQVEPNNSSALRDLGILFHKSKPAEAKKYWEQALQVDKDDDIALESLEELYRNGVEGGVVPQNLPKAEELWERRVEVYLKTYTDIQKMASAIKEKCRAEGKDIPFLGFTIWGLVRRKQAQELLEEALKKNPNTVFALQHMGELYGMEDDVYPANLQKSQELLEKARQLQAAPLEKATEVKKEKK